MLCPLSPLALWYTARCQGREAHCGPHSSASWRAGQRAKWRKVESGSGKAKGGTHSSKIASSVPSIILFVPAASTWHIAFRCVLSRIHLPMQETYKMWVQSLGQEDPLEKEMATTPVFLPGESHGQRSLAGYSPWGHKEPNWSDLACTHVSVFALCHIPTFCLMLSMLSAAMNISSLDLVSGSEWVLTQSLTKVPSKDRLATCGPVSSLS